jgi:hypothetical protein
MMSGSLVGQKVGLQACSCRTNNLQTFIIHEIMPGVPLDPLPLEVRPLQGTIHLHEIRAGCILWLPKKDDIEQRFLTGFDIDDGCFNHPVLVLSTRSSGRKAMVLIVIFGA